MGRQPSITTDALGLLLAVLVAAVGVQESVAGTQLLDQAAYYPSLCKVWVDGTQS